MLLYKVGLSEIWTQDHWIPLRCSNRLRYQTIKSTSIHSQFSTASPISSVVQWQILFWLLFSSVATFICSKFCSGNHLNVAEWTDKYCIHKWMIFKSTYRKLALVEFELTTTEFGSDALNDWAITRWVQPALRANCSQPALRANFSIQISFQVMHSPGTTFIQSTFCRGNYMCSVKSTHRCSIYH